MKPPDRFASSSKHILSMYGVSVWCSVYWWSSDDGNAEHSHPGDLCPPWDEIAATPSKFYDAKIYDFGHPIDHPDKMTAVELYKLVPAMGQLPQAFKFFSDAPSSPLYTFPEDFQIFEDGRDRPDVPIVHKSTSDEEEDPQLLVDLDPPLPPHSSKTPTPPSPIQRPSSGALSSQSPSPPANPPQVPPTRDEQSSTSSPTPTTKVPPTRDEQSSTSSPTPTTIQPSRGASPASTPQDMGSSSSSPPPTAMTPSSPRGNQPPAPSNLSPIPATERPSSPISNPPSSHPLTTRRSLSPLSPLPPTQSTTRRYPSPLSPPPPTQPRRPLSPSPEPSPATESSGTPSDKFYKSRPPTLPHSSTGISQDPSISAKKGQRKVNVADRLPQGPRQRPGRQPTAGEMGTDYRRFISI
jgi:hypothetical protein